MGVSYHFNQYFSESDSFIGGENQSNRGNHSTCRINYQIQLAINGNQTENL
jgi:hypothetical protein